MRGVGYLCLSWTALWADKIQMLHSLRNVDISYRQQQSAPLFSLLDLDPCRSLRWPPALMIYNSSLALSRLILSTDLVVELSVLVLSEKCLADGG